jgi:hypothetical protein
MPTSIPLAARRKPQNLDGENDIDAFAARRSRSLIPTVGSVR